MVSWADFKRVLQHFSIRTRLEGSRGLVWPETTENRPKLQSRFSFSSLRLLHRIRQVDVQPVSTPASDQSEPPTHSPHRQKACTFYVQDWRPTRRANHVLKRVRSLLHLNHLELRPAGTPKSETSILLSSATSQVVTPKKEVAKPPD